jgi:nucleotide-binding universal stress UspA family protein
MFQHILLPTDGSSGSAAPARFCIQFAAQYGAQVTAVHVVEPPYLFAYEPVIPDDALQAYSRNREVRADEIFLPISQLAGEARVQFDGVEVQADDPWDGILQVAHDRGCDLVMIASHGRKGLRGLLLGSQTQKLLTHSAIPVMVLRGLPS